MMFYACDNNDKNIDADKSEVISSEVITDPSILSQISNLGFNVEISPVQFDKELGYYVVEGDILLHPGYISTSGEPSEEQRYLRTISCNEVKNITISIDNGVDADWVAGVDAAISQWNSTGKVNLTHIAALGL